MGEGEMPKETIRSRYREDDPKLGVQVGWNREAEHVQVATVNSDSAELRPTPEGNGWYVQLDRYRINQLIRVLRRARDQAFGRDE
jgi:hypothetical protein